MQLTTQTQEIQAKEANANLVIMPSTMTMSNAPTIRGALLKLINKGANKLVIDLNQVEYIDSSGLSVLVTAYQQLQANEGEVVLLSPSNNVRSLIELTRLHQIFTIYEDKEAALFYISS